MPGGSYAYTPFGVVVSGNTPSPFGFTGELQSQGLVYLRARWYDSRSGTFTSRDPFAGFPQQPYSLHYYQYAYAAPTLWTDPSGEAFCIGGGRYIDPETGECVTDPDHEPNRWEFLFLSLGFVPGPGSAMGGTAGTVGQVGTQTVPHAAQYVDDCFAAIKLLSQLQSHVQTAELAEEEEEKEKEVTFYRGVTYYDGLRAQEEGFNVDGALEKRQQGRELALGPGLYTSRNAEVARYFAYYNSDTLLGFSGQGGPALMTITLPQKKFAEIATEYGVIDNQPLFGLPDYIPEPHVETLFPYTSLPELYANATITVDLLPLE